MLRPWRSPLRDALEALSADAAGRPAPAPAVLEGLPDPVHRYFAFAVPAGAAPVRCMRQEQRGAVRAAPGARWLPYTARLYATADPPGFVWHARAGPSRWAGVEVLDRYRLGVGETRVRLLGVVPLARTSGPEAGASALVRWLGEAATIPTALLPGPHLAWEPVDAASARAVLRVHGHAVSAVFTFDEAGQRLRIDSDDRYRDVGGRPVRTPWTGYFHRFTEVSGFRVPTAGISVWRPAGERAFAAVRLAIEAIRYGAPERK